VFLDITVRNFTTTTKTPIGAPFGAGLGYASSSAGMTGAMV
jgi:hypothetical protein